MWPLLLFIMGVSAVLTLYYFHEEEKKEEEEEEEKKTECISRPSTPLKTFERRFSVSSVFSNFSAGSYENLLERFNSFDEVIGACKASGVRNCNFILGIDFSASNEWQGKKTFGQASLHKLSGNKIYNPYQKVIWVLGQTLAAFDEDGIIPAFGFGDYETRNHSVFALSPSGDACQGFNDVLESYNKRCQHIFFGGPSSLASIIHKSIEIVTTKHTYHILIIVTDGQLSKDDVQKSSEFLVAASKFAMSVVAIGVGDGPWDDIYTLENAAKEKSVFNNFRFVDYYRTTYKVKHPDVLLALNTLMDVPDQYKMINELNYIGESYGEGINYDKILAMQAEKRSWVHKVKQKVFTK